MELNCFTPGKKITCLVPEYRIQVKSWLDSSITRKGCIGGEKKRKTPIMAYRNPNPKKPVSSHYRGLFLNPIFFTRGLFKYKLYNAYCQ